MTGLASLSFWISESRLCKNPRNEDDKNVYLKLRKLSVLLQKVTKATTKNRWKIMKSLKGLLHSSVHVWPFNFFDSTVGSANG